MIKIERPSVRLLAAAGALSFGLAACGGGSGAEGGRSSTQGPTRASSSTSEQYGPNAPRSRDASPTPTVYVDIKSGLAITRTGQKTIDVFGSSKSTGEMTDAQLIRAADIFTAADCVPDLEAPLPVEIISPSQLRAHVLDADCAAAIPAAVATLNRGSRPTTSTPHTA